MDMFEYVTARPLEEFFHEDGLIGNIDKSMNRKHVLRQLKIGDHIELVLDIVCHATRRRNLWAQTATYLKAALGVKFISFVDETSIHIWRVK